MPEPQEELRRALAENRRRKKDIPAERYAPWNIVERWMLDDRHRRAAQMLHRLGVFPDEGTPCLEIGVGTGGWLPTLLAWGVAEEQLHGVDIDAERLADTARRLPAVCPALCDGAALPYADGRFGLVVASTVLTSVLDPAHRRRIAKEIERVLRPGGALVWYDFAVDNPRNDQVRAVARQELTSLFPGLRGETRRITLAPPLARLVAPLGFWSLELLATVPWLRTHLLAVLVRDGADQPS